MAEVFADDAFWATVGDSASDREGISIEIDRDILGFFQRDGRGYQARINAVLRSYMQAKERVR